MASATTRSPDPPKQRNDSPKIKGRESTKETLCRNITIYGRCRYEDKGCTFNHDQSRFNADRKQTFVTPASHSHPSSGSRTPKRSLQSTPVPTTVAVTSKGVTIGPRANTLANNPPPVPVTGDWWNSGLSQFRMSNGALVPVGNVRPDALGGITTGAQPTPEWITGENNITPGYVPPSLDQTPQPLQPEAVIYDPFISTTSAPYPDIAPGAIANPYAQDPMAGAFFSSSGFQAPPQYHLYAPIGPHNPNIAPYQRSVHDLFLSNDMREELQKKSAATLQTLPNTTLPNVDPFHTLVPLDLSHQKSAIIFGYPSWVYKAQSSKDGHFYALRRLEGFRLTNQKAIRAVQNWKPVCSGGVITVHDAFTTRAFGDNSLIFVTDYHPSAKTLVEAHSLAGWGSSLSMSSAVRAGQHSQVHITEGVMWSYVTQIASALKTIHTVGLAARVLDPSKILVTSKNRIRLNACAILDVIQPETTRSISDLQAQDLVNFGQLMVTLGNAGSGIAVNGRATMANNGLAGMQNATKAMEHFGQVYSPQLKSAVWWLLGASQESPDQKQSTMQERKIDTFIRGISTQLVSTFDSSLHLNDQLTSNLARELENGRLFRILAKINFVLDRPDPLVNSGEYQAHWSEHGDRYFLRLFRDYMFQQVDMVNAPVLDLAHVLMCLNKLDAGIEEKVVLVSRDEQSCFVVSYREIKVVMETAFQQLVKLMSRRP